MNSSNRLHVLKNRHAGQRCVLVANGPSLNAMQLAGLRRETIIGLNKIFLGCNKFGFYPRYYLAVNEMVIEQSAARIKAMNCVKFVSHRSAHLLSEGALTYHVNTQDPPSRFCPDIAQGIHEGYTVTHAVLQVAYYLGCKEVVIIGMDHRYRYEGKPNEAHRLVGPDPNHLSPKYFSGQQWDNPVLARSEESYAIARKVFEADGRRIIDATLDGTCSVFEKADYRNLAGVQH